MKRTEEIVAVVVVAAVVVVVVAVEGLDIGTTEIEH